MLDKEPLDYLREINTIKGFAFWSSKIGIKKQNKWIVIEQPIFKINKLTNNQLDIVKDRELKFTSADFMNINKKGGPELILKFKNQFYGNRGGTGLKYIEIWDTDSKVLVLGSLVKEHFHWFSKKEDEGICERKVEYKSGVIKLGKVKCNGATVNFNLAKDKNERIFILKNGKFKLK